MKHLSGAKDAALQVTLWPWVEDAPIRHPAQMRTLVGDFFENALAWCFGGDRMTTDSRCLCPDLRLAEGFLECKSVGNTRQALLFDHSLRKYEAFLAAGNRLAYAFWFHSLACLGIASRGALWRALAQHVEEVVVIGAELVHAEAWRANAQRVNLGEKRGRVSARRIRRGWFREIAAGQAELVLGCTARGVELRPFPMSVVGAPWARRRGEG